ncbi:methyltransferase type 11 [Candidatus Thiomargarita nelsonii]|uniref:Methyltransferase type 11 n=1 Tax=Candidatus Thiomargarita nelsonii TaxID=1003181 RepID=A0A176S298_9GAMM|nr:methyltransferase type 11 [Candidatus Thiomargarita nelsonii]
MDNKNIYQTHEFDSWAYRGGLIKAEDFLIQKYLKKNKKTLEAGTAGGRILFGMLEMGFSDLHGFDFVPEFIEQARKRDKTDQIKFSVEDATALTYRNNEFAQLIYLQQIISAVGNLANARRAVKEAYRILEKDGVVLFSFCNFKERQKHFLYSMLVKYLSILRKIKQSPYSVQHLPWFKLGGRPNLGVFLDKKPYNYWFIPREAYDLLINAGFDVIGVASQKQINESRVLSKIESFEKEEHSGMLYFVCRK